MVTYKNLKSFQITRGFPALSSTASRSVLWRAIHFVSVRFMVTLNMSLSARLLIPHAPLTFSSEILFFWLLRYVRHCDGGQLIDWSCRKWFLSNLHSADRSSSSTYWSRRGNWTPMRITAAATVGDALWITVVANLTNLTYSIPSHLYSVIEKNSALFLRVFFDDLTEL